MSFAALHLHCHLHIRCATAPTVRRLAIVYWSASLSDSISMNFPNCCDQIQIRARMEHRRCAESQRESNVRRTSTTPPNDYKVSARRLGEAVRERVCVWDKLFIINLSLVSYTFASCMLNWRCARECKRPRSRHQSHLPQTIFIAIDLNVNLM